MTEKLLTGTLSLNTTNQPTNLAFTPVTTESCVLALYINSKDKVKSLCDFRFVQNSLKSEIIELKPNFGSLQGH